MPTLIVPGYLGSGEGHWQTWMERQLPNVRRVEQDWYNPILVRWAENVRREIDNADVPVWLVAHSFGCLAAITAASDRANKVAGVMLVAPANPERFTLGGVRKAEDASVDGILNWFIPTEKLPFPSLVVASTDDPWMLHEKARFWSGLWGSQFVTLNKAGHINIESGFGPWLEGLHLLQTFQKQHYMDRDVEELKKPLRQNNLVARQGYVSRVRHATRRYFAMNA